MRVPEAELLDDNLQTYEEFRLQVDREEFEISSEIINFPEIAKPEKPIVEEIQIFPAA